MARMWTNKAPEKRTRYQPRKLQRRRSELYMPDFAVYTFFERRTLSDSSLLARTTDLLTINLLETTEKVSRFSVALSVARKRTSLPTQKTMFPSPILAA